MKGPVRPANPAPKPATTPVEIDEAEYQAFVQRFNLNVATQETQQRPQPPTRPAPRQPAPTAEAKPEKKPLSKQEERFLARKNKVLATIYKLAVDHPQRATLEAKVAQIEQSQAKDGKAAYKELGAVKSEARKAAKNMAVLSPQKIEEEVRQFDQEISFLSSSAGELLTRADQLKTQITALPKTSSFKPGELGARATATGFGAQAAKADGPREKFDRHLAALAMAESRVRADFGQLAGEKNAVVKQLQAGQFAEREANIRKEIAFLEAKQPGCTGLLAGKLDQAQARLAHAGKPLTEVLLNNLLAQKEQELAVVLAEWKDWGGTRDRGPDGPVKATLRGNLAADLLEEDMTDAYTLADTQEQPRVVEAPYQWDLAADLDDLTAAFPQSEAAVNAATVQAAKAAGKKFIADAFTAHADDPDFVFDLSIQTRPALTALLMREANLESVFQMDDALVQKAGHLASASNNKNHERYKGYLEGQSKEKQTFLQSGDAAKYITETNKRLGRITEFLQGLESGPDSEQSQNTIDALKMLVKTLTKELEGLPVKQIELVRDVAGEMAATIAEKCPNSASTEKQEFDIPVPGGGTEKFSVPEKIALNQQEYRVKKCLGAGAMGVAFAYEDASGNTVVVKSSKSTDPAEQEATARELKMHQHLMGSDGSDGMHNVLKLEGVARSPDGGFFMILEHADGGGLDRLGDSMRALSGSNIISQEAANAMQQNLVLQAVKGLKYLQERNMTHHDIKADNFFMAADGTVKLADFGSAQVADNPEGEVPGAGKNSAVVGAGAFRAPEFGGQTMTGKADTFTLGTMIAGLTSPINAEDRFKRTDFSDTEFASATNLTALDRLKNAMLDPDPSKRPRIEAVEYSSYLADAGSHDPGQVQDLIKASIAYSLKAGKQVSGKQQDIDKLKGSIADAEYKSTPFPDDKLTTELQGKQAGEVVRQRLTAATTALSAAMKRRDAAPDAADAALRSNSDPDKTMARALQLAREAEKLCALGNVTDPALLKEVTDQIAATQLQYSKLVESLRSEIAQHQKEIDDINQQPDVKPLLDNLKKADEALRRGPDDGPEKKAATAVSIEHQSKQLQALAAKVNGTEQVAKKFKAAEELATAKNFDGARKILDEIQQELRDLGQRKIEMNRASRLGKVIAAATTLAPNEVSVLNGTLTKASRFIEGGMLGPARPLLEQIETYLKQKKVPLSGPNVAPDRPAGKADKTV